jgi:membrane protein YdbS with pleckstrin-like domain
MEKELLIIKKSYQIINTIELVLVILAILSTIVATMGLFLSPTLYAIGFIALCVEIVPVIPLIKISDHLRWKMSSLKKELRIQD